MTPHRASPLVAAAVLAAAATLLAPALAQARPVHPHRHVAARPAGIYVDVGPLLAKGLGPYAQEVRADLTRALEAQFGGGLPGGERLVATIESISLTSWTGQMDSDFLGPNDYIDGYVTLIAPDGRVLTRQRIQANSPAWSGGAWYVQGNELRRTAALANIFAGWARRYVAG